jgi:hypothetical protein
MQEKEQIHSNCKSSVTVWILPNTRKSVKAHTQTHENMKWAQNNYVPHLVKFAMKKGATPNIMRNVILMLEDIQYEATQ